MEKHLDYWRRQLAGMSAELALPADYPRPAARSYRGGCELFSLPAELSEALRALSRREGATLFMLLLAAFQTLLHRYAGQDDIVVGADVANRNRAETEGLIGFFVNMMVMRADFSSDPSFRDLLKQVREVSLEAYAHQDVPFDRLVDELQPERTPGVTPLFQVVFVLQNAPMPPLELPGLELDILEVESGTAQFDLILSMGDDREGLTGGLTYNTDIFAAATVRRMLTHFQTLLESIVGAPGQNVSELRLFTQDELEGFDSLDVPELGMSQRELENLMLELGNIAAE
jgi:non-ribosomal peptide synthetase component F